MEPIGEINIQSITIPQARSWMYQIPAVPNNDPPVTLQLGFPIVELPGCVETHKDNKINSFMRYRVAIQFVSLLILTIALYYKT